MSLVRGLVRGILPGGGGAAADPVLSYPSGVVSWTAKTGADYGGYRRVGGTVPTPTGDNSVRGVLPQDLDDANSIEYLVGGSDMLWLPWFGGCLSHIMNVMMNPGVLRRAVSEGAYDWTVGGVFSCCNYEGLNVAGTSGGGIFNFDKVPLTDYMGVGLFRRSSDSGLLTFRRQATETLTSIYPRAGNNAFLITSTASGLTHNFNGVISSYSALSATVGGATSIEDIEFGRALNSAAALNTFAHSAVLWAHGMYSGTALTPTEQAAAMAMMMEYFEIPSSTAAITVCIGDSLMGYSGDVTAGGLTSATGGLATQIASANTARIVYAACHGAYIPSQIVSPDCDASRVVMRFGANAAYLFGKSDEASYIANQATRRLAILAEIEDRVDDAKTQYPGAAFWYVLPTGISQAQYDAENPDFWSDYSHVRGLIVAAAGTGVWSGVTQVDAGTDWINEDLNIDRIHETSGRVKQILDLMPAVVA